MDNLWNFFEIGFFRQQKLGETLGEKMPKPSGFFLMDFFMISEGLQDRDPQQKVSRVGTKGWYHRCSEDQTNSHDRSYYLTGQKLGQKTNFQKLRYTTFKQIYITNNDNDNNNNDNKN